MRTDEIVEGATYEGGALRERRRVHKIDKRSGFAACAHFYCPKTGEPRRLTLRSFAEWATRRINGGQP